MNRYDAWLEEPYQEAYERDDWVTERMDELIAGDYNPYKPANIVEAISEECLFQGDDLDRLQELLEKREIHKLGLFVFGRIIDYWERQAENHAMEDWANGNRD